MSRLVSKTNNIQGSSSPYHYISSMTRCGCRVVAQLCTTWPVPFTYLYWKPDSSFMRWLSKLGGPQAMSFNMKSRPGHEHLVVDSIGRTLRPGRGLQSWKPSSQQYHIITALVTYISIESPLYWIVLIGCWPYKKAHSLFDSSCF